MAGGSLIYGCQNGMNTLALAIGVPLMNVFAVALRFYTRRRQESRFGADDWWSLAGLIILVGMGIDLLVAAVNKVLSCPMPDNEIAILREQGALVPRVAWAFFLLGVLGVGAVKMTFLYCMRRVFCTGEKGTFFSKITYTVMAFVYLWTFGFLVTMVVINVNWGEPNQGDPAKWASVPATPASDTMFYALTVSDVIIDGLIMFLPMLVIWQLNLSLGRKFAISGIFLLRMLALAASITRMSYTIEFVKWMNEILNVDPLLTDLNHLLVGQNLNTQMIWWTMFEVGFGLFASCITMMQFLMRRRHVQHVNDQLMKLFGLQVKDRSQPFPELSETKPTPRGSGSRSRHDDLYRDDQSVLSAEYMVGSIRDTAAHSRLADLKDYASDGATTVETRHIYVRKSSSASMSTTTAPSELTDVEDIHAVGRAV